MQTDQQGLQPLSEINHHPDTLINRFSDELHAGVMLNPSNCSSLKRTHEDYIHAVRQITVDRLNDETVISKLLAAKLTYGAGQPGFRGHCFYGAWENGDHHEFIEVHASGEESPIQLAGTTIHELAHCRAGPQAGHGRLWKLAASRLGLVRAQAAGQDYSRDDFDSEVLSSILHLLPLLSDGRPAFTDLNRGGLLGVGHAKLRPCPLGIGTRGGSFQGPGIWFSSAPIRLLMRSSDPHPCRAR